ncbi:MAG: ATP-binding protein [Deltaproteobacteria bacterium]|nr:ATP-binding protein [Deltaproteobacteria bacterium]
MLELSMHILDVVENSTRAGATSVEIEISEDTVHDRLTVEITDNGRGMDPATLRKCFDPFFTSKTVRRIGLGIPMLHQAARATGGSISVASIEGSGTRIEAIFRRNHIDRQPLGDMAATITALIMGNELIDFRYCHRKDEMNYCFDTRDIRREAPEIPITHREIITFIKNAIREGLEEIGVRS